MVSVNTLVKKILDVKDIIVEDVELYEDEEGVKHLKVMARVYKRADDRCPKCGRKCSRYDSPKRNGRPVRKRWRALDFAGIIVEIQDALAVWTDTDFITLYIKTCSSSLYSSV